MNYDLREKGLCPKHLINLTSPFIKYFHYLQLSVKRFDFFLQGFIFEESVKKIDYIDYRIKADNTALGSAEV